VAVAFDAVGSATSLTSATATISWTHTAGTGGSCGIVAVCWSDASWPPTVNSATYGGVAMTLLASQASNNNTLGGILLWGFTGGANGANTVTVTFSAAPSDILLGNSVSFTGASALGTAVKAAAAASPATVTVTGTTSGNMVVAAECHGSNGSSTTWGTATSRFDNEHGVNTGASNISGATAAAGGSVTMTGTLSVSDWNGIIAVEVQAGGPPATSANAGVATSAASAPQPGIAGQVTSQGVPVNTHATSGSVTGTWPTGSSQVAGRLLVAVVTSAAATSTAALNTPSGWTKQLEEPNSATAHSRSVIYTKTAAGGDSAPAFTSTLSGTGAMDCMLFELIGADTTTITDTSGVFASGSSSGTLANATFTATTSGTPHAGSFAIAVFNQERAAANLTFADSGTGWTKILNGNGVSSVCQTAILVQNPPTSAERSRPVLDRHDRVRHGDRLRVPARRPGCFRGGRRGGSGRHRPGAGRHRPRGGGRRRGRGHCGQFQAVHHRPVRQ